MYRPSSRLLLRQTLRTLPTRSSQPSKRLISTAPPAQKSRSWKSSATRWGLAIGGIYYYNTSNVFAEEPSRAPQSLLRPRTQILIMCSVAAYPPPSTSIEDENLPTLDSLSPSRKFLPPSPPPSLSQTVALDPTASPPSTSPPAPTPEMPSEDEAASQGAFNEETGEINWDCPCLGGMAHGPCGEQFREAFSCFVYSKEEPKGMDCIDKFKGMQACFAEHPDVYGGIEGDDDEMDEEGMGELGTAGAEGEGGRDGGEGLKGREARPGESKLNEEERAARSRRAQEATEQVERDHGVASEGRQGREARPGEGKLDGDKREAGTSTAMEATGQVEGGHAATSESQDIVPKAAHDARDSPTEK